MTEPQVSKHASFEIVFLPHFSDSAAQLLEKLKDRGFLERLASNTDDVRAELSDLGIEIKGKDSKLLDHDKEIDKLQQQLSKFVVREHKNPPQLGWCKLAAIAAAATEAAP